MSEKYEVDFYKELGLPRPIVCGLVSKIISPKGIRKMNSNDQYEYHLNHQLVQIYYDNTVVVDEGIYWVMDIHKEVESGQLKWLHYLVVVEDDGSFYPVDEFLNCHDSTWIKNALPTIKAYFNKEELDPIELTKFKKPVKKSTWNIKR